jgi:hypothetical protein
MKVAGELSSAGHVRSPLYNANNYGRVSEQNCRRSRFIKNAVLVKLKLERARKAAEIAAQANL